MYCKKNFYLRALSAGRPAVSAVTGWWWPGPDTSFLTPPPLCLGSLHALAASL